MEHAQPADEERQQLKQRYLDRAVAARRAHVAHSSALKDSPRPQVSGRLVRGTSIVRRLERTGED